MIPFWVSAKLKFGLILKLKLLPKLGVWLFSIILFGCPKSLLRPIPPIDEGGVVIEPNGAEIVDGVLNCVTGLDGGVIIEFDVVFVENNDVVGVVLFVIVVGKNDDVVIDVYDVFVVDLNENGVVVDVLAPIDVLFWAKLNVGTEEFELIVLDVVVENKDWFRLLLLFLFVLNNEVSGLFVLVIPNKLEVVVEVPKFNLGNSLFEEVLEFVIFEFPKPVNPLTVGLNGSDLFELNVDGAAILELVDGKLNKTEEAELFNDNAGLPNWVESKLKFLFELFSFWLGLVKLESEDPSVDL